MLTVKEVAQRLRISVSGTYALIASGKLVAYAVGVHQGNLRISEEDLQTYLDSCRRSSDSATLVKQAQPVPHLKHLRL